MPDFWFSLLNSPVMLAIGMMLLFANAAVVKFFLDYRIKLKKLELKKQKCESKLRQQELELERQKLELQQQDFHPRQYR